jgi:hypothetical protein
MDYSKIICMVGDKRRIVDADLFSAVHEELADKYRALGLRGQLLDLAIVANLPRRLAEMLDEGEGETRH